MKKIITHFLCLMASSIFASEFQMVEGASAFALYKSLPGKTCTEWNSADLVVYTKYQTPDCSQSANDADWTCTIQINKKDPNKAPFVSASCTRQIE